MSVGASSSYKGLEQTAQSIFCDMPAQVRVNEESTSRYASSLKIEVLIEELRKNGPHVGIGNIGPLCYVDAPFKLANPVNGKDVYGWKPDAQRVDIPSMSRFFIVGAKKFEDREIVYFTLSEDVTTDLSSPIRQHQPSSADQKVYVVSHKTFLNHLTDVYVPVASTQAAVPETKEDFAKLLIALPLEKILDEGVIEKRCKEIGQQIFDDFKAKAGGKSIAGKEAMQKVCKLIVQLEPKNGFYRKECIARAWFKVGDANWIWMP